MVFMVSLNLVCVFFSYSLKLFLSGYCHIAPAIECKPSRENLFLKVMIIWLFKGHA